MIEVFHRFAYEKLQNAKESREKFLEIMKGIIEAPYISMLPEKDQAPVPKLQSPVVHSTDNAMHELDTGSELPTFPSRITAKAVRRVKKISTNDNLDNFNDEGLEVSHASHDDTTLPANSRKAEFVSSEARSEVKVLAMTIFDGQIRLKNVLTLSPYYDWDGEKLKNLLIEGRTIGKWRSTRKKVLTELGLKEMLKSG
jgi:hypothetical protein